MLTKGRKLTVYVTAILAPVVNLPRARVMYSGNNKQLSEEAFRFRWPNNNPAFPTCFVAPRR